MVGFTIACCGASVASRSSGLKGVALCMHFLFARAGEITRVCLWALNCGSLHSFRSVSRLCARRQSAFVISPPFAYGAAKAFPVSSPKKKKRGFRRLVIIRGRDGSATVSRERFRTYKENHDGEGWRCVKCASCVMMVMAMTVNCGGEDSDIDG